MKRHLALVAAVVVPLGLVPRPAEATHNCTKEEPRCVDRRTLVEKPERQVITSRVLGHHCYDDFSAGLPDRDKRVLYSRIEVAFSNVTHRDPRPGGRPSVSVDCEGQHGLQMEVAPPSPPRCRKPGGPCPS